MPTLFKKIESKLHTYKFQIKQSKQQIENFGSFIPVNSIFNGAYIGVIKVSDFTVSMEDVFKSGPLSNKSVPQIDTKI